jgi:hypothetical protein
MNQTRNKSLSGFTASLLSLSVIWFCSCTAVSALQGKPGLDVSRIKAGMSKVDAEQILGSPIREWVTSSGVSYGIYDYDAGVPPSGSEAAANVFMDIISVGVWELFGAFGHQPELRKREQMAVSYDVDGLVIGTFDHFGDFDVLPADGRADK